MDAIVLNDLRLNLIKCMWTRVFSYECVIHHGDRDIYRGNTLVDYIMDVIYGWNDIPTIVNSLNLPPCNIFCARMVWMRAGELVPSYRHLQAPHTNQCVFDTSRSVSPKNTQKARYMLSTRAIFECFVRYRSDQHPTIIIDMFSVVSVVSSHVGLRYIECIWHWWCPWLGARLQYLHC